MILRERIYRYFFALLCVAYTATWSYPDALYMPEMACCVIGEAEGMSHSCCPTGDSSADEPSSESSDHCGTPLSCECTFSSTSLSITTYTSVEYSEAVAHILSDSEFNSFYLPLLSTDFVSLSTDPPRQSA